MPEKVQGAGRSPRGDRSDPDARKHASHIDKRILVPYMTHTLYKPVTSQALKTDPSRLACSCSAEDRSGLLSPLHRKPCAILTALCASRRAGLRRAGGRWLHKGSSNAETLHALSRYRCHPDSRLV